MGAGGSVQKTTGAATAKPVAASTKGATSAQAARNATPPPAPPSQLRLIPRHLPPGSTLRQGVGEVIGARTLKATGVAIPTNLPPPPSPLQAGRAAVLYGWFVEDLERPGQFDAYNTESSARLEDAFRARRPTCLVTLQKHMYTVDLTTMQQLPAGATNAVMAAQTAGRVRAVKRAAVEEYTDPATGQKLRREAETAARLADPFADEQESTGDNAATAVSEVVQADVYSTALDGATATSTYPSLTQTVVVHTKPIYTLHLSPPTANVSGGGARQLALSGSMYRQLYEWDVETGAVATTYDLQLRNPFASVSILSAHYAPLSGKFIIAGCDDRIARLYRRGDATPVHQLKGHTHKVYGVGLTHDDAIATTGAMDGFVKRWDVETGSELTSEHCHSSHIFVIKTSHASSYMAWSAGDDTYVCVHDFRQAQSVVQRLPGHTKTIWDCDVRPQDEQQYISAGMDSTIRVWDPRNPSNAIDVIEHHTKPIHSARYTANGRGILSSSKDQHVFLTEIETGAPVWRAKAHAATVFRALYSPITNQIYTAGGEGCVNCWNWSTGHEW